MAINPHDFNDKYLYNYLIKIEKSFIKYDDMLLLNLVYFNSLLGKRIDIFLNANSSLFPFSTSDNYEFFDKLFGHSSRCNYGIGISFEKLCTIYNEVSDMPFEDTLMKFYPHKYKKVMEQFKKYPLNKPLNCSAYYYVKLYSIK